MDLFSFFDVFDDVRIKSLKDIQVNSSCLIFVHFLYLIAYNFI